MNTIEASFFFFLAVFPWLMLITTRLRRSSEAKANWFGILIIAPAIYWIITRGLDDMGLLAILAVAPGWTAGFEALANDVFNTSIVDLMQISRCPCETSSWRTSLWIILGGCIGGISFGFVDKKETSE